jgi:hypothetical protein
MFAILAALLVGGGLVIAMHWSRSFSAGAWYTAAALLVLAGLGRAIAQHKLAGGAALDFLTFRSIRGGEIAHRAHSTGRANSRHR